MCFLGVSLKHAVVLSQNRSQQVDRSVPVVNPAEVRQFGLVLSRFTFDGGANDQCR
jgi:hypothetical protein